MDDNSAWVRVIVVNYNSGGLLQRCVDALAAQTFRDFEVVVFDNASADGSAEDLRLPDDRFRLERAGANLGFAAANNLAATGCSAPWIATLNPDAEPRRNWLEELNRATLRHKGVAMFGSTQLQARAPDRVDGFGDAYSIYGTAWRGASGRPVASLPDGDRDVFAPCAASALYARDAFRAAGGFDQSFFCYLEDVDLGFRLRLKGMRCVQVRAAEVLHVGSASAGANSSFFLFHSQRNRIWVMLKDVPAPLLFLVMALQLLATPISILRRGEGWRTALKGVAAGFTDFRRVLRERKAVQKSRTAGNAEIARMLVWDPRKALKLAPHFIEPPKQA
jgi:N-acetylglucosaminyl-diphospho-decaprenol L-rhamnosyltransferase